MGLRVVLCALPKLNTLWRVTVRALGIGAIQPGYCSLVGVRRCQRGLSQTQSYCLNDTELPTDATVCVLSCAYGLHGWSRPLTWGGQFAFVVPGPVWLGLAWFGSFSLVRLGLAWCCLAWSVLVWLGLSFL